MAVDLVRIHASVATRDARGRRRQLDWTNGPVGLTPLVSFDLAGFERGLPRFVVRVPGSIAAGLSSTTPRSTPGAWWLLCCWCVCSVGRVPVIALSCVCSTVGQRVGVAVYWGGFAVVGGGVRFLGG